MCDNTVNSVPEWLNVHFLAAILQNHYKNEEITVINSNLKEAIAKGASLLYRISVTFGVSLVGEEVSFGEKTVLTFLKGLFMIF